MCKTAVKILMVGVLLLCGALPAAAVEAIDGCLQPEEHESTTYLLVDRSDELKDTANLKQSLQVVRGMIAPAERLIVGVSTGSAASTRVVMDIVRPKESLWVSKLKIRAAQKKFDDCFEKMQSTLLQQNESYESSALIETLGVVAKALSSDPAGKKRVILYSDMVQNSSAISFYRRKAVDPAGALKEVERERLLASFPKVDFHVAGAGTGVSDKKARDIEAFWKQYIEATGGTLKFYGPVLFAS